MSGRRHSLRHTSRSPSCDSSQSRSRAPAGLNRKHSDRSRSSEWYSGGNYHRRYRDSDNVIGERNHGSSEHRHHGKGKDGCSVDGYQSKKRIEQYNDIPLEPLVGQVSRHGQ